MKNSLYEAFDIQRKTTNMHNVSDYDIFPDKKLLDTLRTKIIENIIDKDIPEDKSLTEFINDSINNSIMGYDLTHLERSHLYNLIDNEINGYGPLTELLKDKNITEIMVNSPEEIYIEIDGQLIKDEGISFIDKKHIIRTIRRLIEPLGRTIDVANPMVDCRLLDGSRINAVIPPLSPKGPVITIRKFKDSMASVEDLIRIGALTPYMARFLEAAVQGKLNIIVCGGTGSGKTTLLNILSGFIQENERIITIEDEAELKLKQNHVISLETRTINDKNKNEITIRDLVIHSLHMRPDRIIVGEVRGKEAFDMLQAMNTGHEGSITTLHANSCEDALNRLETMILMSGIKLPIKSIREYILNAIDLVVNIERMSDGKRKITSICEITGFKEETLELSKIFEFKQMGLTQTNEVDGEYILYGNVPNVYKKIVNRGIHSIDDIFEKFLKKEKTKTTKKTVKKKK